MLPSLYRFVFVLFPKNAFTRLMGKVADTPWPQPLLGWGIRAYAWWFAIDLAECAQPVGDFRRFNEFFARGLKPQARPVDASPQSVVSPVDGRVSMGGAITQGRLIQAKGMDYRLEELLGGDSSWREYEGGQFLTLYLSPRDYHRIHTPLACQVTRWGYVPGALWTVSPLGVRGVPGLFARNERLISFLRTTAGEMALVKVGATVVGRVKVVYGPAATRQHKPGRFEVLSRPYPLNKGEELGRFEIGSTVILLFKPGQAALNPLSPGTPVRMGQSIGRLLKEKP
ncbi:MAG: archaetidylserine decarboxylase [Deltaproteobacteria bacterium]|nr:archaetidylserine decarboxylase [Deltaproteobacteria bacterium]